MLSEPAYLRDYDGASYTMIASVTLDLDSQSPSPTAERTLTFSGLSYTVSAGNRLQVKIIVTAASDRDMWFAHDTVSSASRLEIDSVKNGDLYPLNEHRREYALTRM